MQQATVNLFADMGVQPGTLQAGLVAASQSTDVFVPPQRCRRRLMEHLFLRVQILPFPELPAMVAV